MKTIEIEVGKLKPNPFKKHISNGKLDSKRVKKLEESIDHGTLPYVFTGRKAGDIYEIGSGHHRQQAMINKKGKTFKVVLSIVDYSDEQMLVDMIRENLTHRDTNFQDVEESVVLAREWLHSKLTDVKRFNSSLKKLKNGRTAGPQHQELPGSARDIQKFLSKQGNTISHVTIQSYLKIYDYLDKGLHSKVGKLESATKEESEGKLQKRVASELATIGEEKNKKFIPDYNAQKILFSGMQKEKMNKDDSIKVISNYKKADETTKRLVLEKKIDITSLIPDLKNRKGELVTIKPKNIDEHIAELNDVGLAYTRKLKEFSSKHLVNCNKSKRNFLKFHIASTLQQLKKFYDKIEKEEFS